MKGSDVHGARRTLGRLWGFGRDLMPAELGRAIRLAPTRSGQQVRRWEARGDEAIPGPAAAAIEMMLAGALPPDGLEVVRARG